MASARSLIVFFFSVYDDQRDLHVPTHSVPTRRSSDLQTVEVPMKEHSDLPPALRKELVEVKVAMVGLPPDAAHKFPAELSGGMRKRAGLARALARSEEHTSEIQSLMRISYAVFCFKKKKSHNKT